MIFVTIVRNTIAVATAHPLAVAAAVVVATVTGVAIASSSVLGLILVTRVQTTHPYADFLGSEGAALLGRGVFRYTTTNITTNNAIQRREIEQKGQVISDMRKRTSSSRNISNSRNR